MPGTAPDTSLQSVVATSSATVNATTSDACSTKIIALRIDTSGGVDEKIIFSGLANTRDSFSSSRSSGTARRCSLITLSFLNKKQGTNAVKPDTPSFGALPIPAAPYTFIPYANTPAANGVVMDNFAVMSLPTPTNLVVERFQQNRLNLLSAINDALGDIFDGLLETIHKTSQPGRRKAIFEIIVSYVDSIVEMLKQINIDSPRNSLSSFGLDADFEGQVVLVIDESDNDDVMADIQRQLQTPRADGCAPALRVG